MADTREELYTLIAANTETSQKACDKAIPAIGRRTENAKYSWHSKDLEQLKRNVLQKKRRIRNAASNRVKAIIQEYSDAKETYTEKA